MSPETPRRERTVTSRGASLYTFSTGAGAPLLLLHGWTLDHRAFQPQIEALAASFEVIAFDRRGCGRSSGSPDLGAELHDIDSVIAAYGGGPVHLLGVSQGGRLALRYAASRPALLRSLILQGAVLDGFNPPDLAGEAVPLADYRQWLQEGRLDAVREHWLAHPMMNQGLRTDEQRARLRHIVADYSGEDLLATQPAPPDITARLRQLPIPVLIITGSLEVSARQLHAQRLLELLPAGAEATIEGAGHLSNFSHAAQYNALVSDFCLAAG